MTIGKYLGDKYPNDRALPDRMRRDECEDARQNDVATCRGCSSRGFLFLLGEDLQFRQRKFCGKCAAIAGICLGIYRVFERNG